MFIYILIIIYAIYILIIIMLFDRNQYRKIITIIILLINFYKYRITNTYIYRDESAYFA